MITVSVVIPMHNASAWIEATLDSVRTQTYPASQIETVIVDDCSSDNSVAVARAYLARHGMAGRVIESERNQGVGAARNTGWRAAHGEWIQFLDADDLLAADKLELQAGPAEAAGADVAVVGSCWQRLAMVEGRWQPDGPITEPELDRSPILKIVTLNAGFLGPALIRRRFLEAVSGFSEKVKYAEDSHLLLKLAAAGGRFVEVASRKPLFFIRQTPGSKSRSNRANVARQHMDNAAIAERLLRERNFGEIGAEDAKELSGLCDWALSELYKHDQAAFRQYLQWVLEIDPAFVPRHSAKLRLASRLVGYENAESLAAIYRRLRGWLASYRDPQAVGATVRPRGL